MARVEGLVGFVEVSGVLLSGVYALVSKGTVIYVGQSKSLYQRIYAHRTRARRIEKGQKLPDWISARAFVFDQVFIRPAPLDQLDQLEQEAIERYKPKFNVQHKSTLRPRLTVPLTINGFALLRPSLEPITRRAL